MWESVQAPLFFGLIAAFATSVGLVAVAARADWSQRHADLFGLVAAGMLITLSILHITPEALSFSSQAPLFILGGFFGGLVMRFVVAALTPASEYGPKAEAITPLVAVGLHSFIDGVIYAVTFAESFTSGVYASVGLILHEFPEGVIAFAIMRRHGFSNRTSFLAAFFAAAATTPLGVMVAAPVLFHVSPETIGDLFAVSAGLLLYVATGPLMAPLREQPAGKALPALGAGVAIAACLALAPLPGHEHDHAHDHDAPLDFRTVSDHNR